MGVLATKAAEERSKWIVDKYHYGVECNTCKYEWEYWMTKEFISQCFDVCTDTVTTTTVDTSLDCSSNAPTYVASTQCTSDVEILDCNQEYKTIEIQAFEHNAYIYSTVVTSSLNLRFEFDSITVNSTSYLAGTRYLDITPSNITTTNVGSLVYVTNLINYLNSFNLPGFVFGPGSSARTMKVRFPSSTTWSITTLANADYELTHGATINQAGLVNLQLLVGGGLVTAPFGGSIDDQWEEGITSSITGYLC